MGFGPPTGYYRVIQEPQIPFSPTIIASLLALGVGPLVAAATQRIQSGAMRVLLVGTVFLVLAQVMPEAISEGGWWMVMPFIVGMGIPSALERLRKTQTAHTFPLGLIAVGLIGHALLDGAAMGAPEHQALGWAVVMHRVPASAATWMVIRPAWGQWPAVGILVATGVTTLLGVFAGEALVHAHHGTLVPIFASLVAGSLLHVVTHAPHEHPPHDHPHHGHHHH